MSVPRLPTGTVTFLFTDIEGSTRLWQRQPEGMKTALAALPESGPSAARAPRMQDVDRISNVETLPEPSRRTGVRANDEAFLIVPCS